MKNKRIWVTRTVRDGRVRIYGKDYKPSHQWQEYKDELEGMRYVFSRYYRGNGNYEPFVYLWGSEESSRLLRTDYDAWLEAEPGGPEVMEDGGLPWCFWNEVSDGS